MGERSSGGFHFTGLINGSGQWYSSGGNLKQSDSFEPLRFLDFELSGSDFSVISAFQPKEPREENDLRHTHLIFDIRKAGYGYFILVADWLENGVVMEEKLLFVPKISAKDAIGFGRTNDQASILVKASTGLCELAASNRGGHEIGEVIRYFSKKSTISEKEFVEAFSQWRQRDRTVLNTQTSSSQLMSLRVYVHRIVFAANPDGSRPMYLVYEYKG